MRVDPKRFALLAGAMAQSCVAVAPEGADAPSTGAPSTGAVAVAAPAELHPALSDEPAGAPSADLDRSGGDESSGRDALRDRCRKLQAPAPSCESFEDTRIECEAFTEVLQEEAAERAVRCLTSRSGRTSICRYDVVEDCFMQAVRSMQPSRATRKSCQDVVASCGQQPRGGRDLSIGTCQRGLAAVNEELGGDLLTCMADQCSVSACVWGLERR
ncbi:MAG: hypothetical protein R3B72_13850 [Polyangiaceae bacterium]